MKRKFIPVEEAFVEWRKDPEYMAAYDRLEGEFASAGAALKAAIDIGLADVAAGRVKDFDLVQIVERGKRSQAERLAASREG
jgi:hypothetical protein